MRSLASAISLCMCCSLLTACSTIQPPSPVEKLIALESVNLIAMTDPETPVVLEAQTVIVENGRIARIGDASSIQTPAGARIINCKGKYLLPGLVDMHVHINSPKDLIAFLLNGVTTVQNMWGYEDWRLSLMGFPDQLKLREQVRHGQRMGPTIYTAGPVFEGTPRTHPFMMTITNIEQARSEVMRQKQKGYDFIKVYDNLSKDVYAAIVQAAMEAQIPVKGHVPFSVGLSGVIQSGQTTIDHLTGFIDADKAAFLISESEIDAYARHIAKAGVWNCPTVVIWQKRGFTEDEVKEQKKHEGMKYLSFMQRIFLDKSVQVMNTSITYKGDYRGKMLQLNQRVLTALRKAGAGLVVGTDTGNPFVFPGWSFHEELQYYVDAGFSNHAVLLAATRNAAAALGKLDQFGTIEEGKIADLLVVNKNPLREISNLTAVEGVMAHGRWYPRQLLEAMLKQ